MKGRLFFEILAVLLVLLICAGLIMLKHYLSDNMFEKDSLVVPSREEQLIEMRANMLEKIEGVEERNQLVENMIELGQITVEEGDYLLGITDSL